MKRIVPVAALAILSAAAAVAQEAIGTLTLTIDGEERPFVLVQGSEGPNPGSRYSEIGQDVVMTLVGVSGEEPQPPEDAAATIELRFTVDGSGPEVRSGSVVSYTTTTEEGMLSTRGGTAEVEIDELAAEEDSVTATGRFEANLPPDEISAGTEVAGTFRSTMMSRDAVSP